MTIHINLSIVISVIFILLLLTKENNNNNIISNYNIQSALWKCPFYRIRETQYKAQYKEDIYVINYFLKRNISIFNRVFVEIGAFDGFDMSNTYALEIGYSWKGLLVEASVNIFNRLIKTNRPRSIKINAAVCNEEGFVEYNDNNVGLGGITKYINNKKVKKTYNVRCSPISKIIKENNIRYIDLFSLDVEGAEEEVLKTFDWNIPVRLWIIEVNAIKLNGSESEKQKCKNVQNTLIKHGYKYIGVSLSQSVNEFYENTNFYNLARKYMVEDNIIYRTKKCYYKENIN